MLRKDSGTHRKKNEKFPYYDTSVDECWLVIVSDMNSIASRYTFIQDKEHLREVKVLSIKYFTSKISVEILQV